MVVVLVGWLVLLGLAVCVLPPISTLGVPNTTLRLVQPKNLEEQQEKVGGDGEGPSRGRRAISEGDMKLILDLHNQLRSHVHPPSSNMEFMVWDYALEQSAESWAQECRWEHGPNHMLTQMGQNLGAHWGRDRPPTYHVQAWYDEVRDYSYPYPQECTPHCPYRCSGPVCTHYTQMVWATSSRIGCAINMCYNMNVWGMVWTKAFYLVCNYSPPGNWWGHAPYKYGTPCSACPANYAGGCRNNLCYRDVGVERRLSPERDIDPEPLPQTPEPLPQTPEPLPQTPEPLPQTPEPLPQTPEPLPQTPEPLPQTPEPSPEETGGPSQVRSTEQMSQQVECDTKLRDQCKGTTCNRYECPPGCLDRPGKVVGSGYYDMQSSVCGAALHAGVIDNDGGWLDVTRLGRKQHFSRSLRNGVQSVGKNTSANSFKVATVPVKAVTCETTGAVYCPFKKPLRHCPRLYCPRNCGDSKAQVIGTRYYSDKSSVCRAALHAGVLSPGVGGYLDLMPLEQRGQYSGTQQNRITSASLINPTGGKAFRVFAVI